MSHQTCNDGFNPFHWTLITPKIISII